MAFQILNKITKTNKKYKFVRRSVCFKLNEIPQDVNDPEEWVKDGVKDIVALIGQDVDPEDKIGFTFGSDCFGKGDAYISFKKAGNVTFDEIWNLLGKMYQSNSEGLNHV